MAKSRFIKSVAKASGDHTPKLPWARGMRRTAFIARRSAAATLRRSA